MESVTVPITPVVDDKAAEEKIGRWSEEEHNVFLDGLQTHGKQWKTISNMIGTRTVVQVRTHAQKYFQKLERKNKTKSSASVAVSISHTKASKRKSLPATLPSRKKAKSVASTRQTVSRTASLSLVNVDHGSTSEMQQAYVSTSSLSTGDWSTVSPTGINEFEVLTASSTEDLKDDLYLLEDNLVGTETTVPVPADSSADDPLDWLIDGGIGHLPESSLGQPPMFPDFSDLSDDKHVLEAQSKSVQEVPPSKPFDTSVLQDIADPKVTVQSLFLDDGDAHLL